MMLGKTAGCVDTLVRKAGGLVHQGERLFRRTDSHAHDALQQTELAAVTATRVFLARVLTVGGCFGNAVPVTVSGGHFR